MTGLTSADGRMLNGRVGSVVQYIKDEDKYEVSFGKDRLVILRSEYLQKCESAGAADASVAKVERPPAEAKTTGASLASLLGMGRQDESLKSAGNNKYQPVWARNGTEYLGPVMVNDHISEDPTCGISVDQQVAVSKLHADEENEATRKSEIRKQIADEFAQAGVFEEPMIEETYQQQLEKRSLRVLQTGRSRSRSRG